MKAGRLLTKKYTWDAKLCQGDKYFLDAMASMETLFLPLILSWVSRSGLSPLHISVVNNFPSCLPIVAGEDPPRTTYLVPRGTKWAASLLSFNSLQFSEHLLAHKLWKCTTLARFLLENERLGPCMLVRQTCSFSTWRLKQEEHKFKVSLTYTAISKTGPLDPLLFDLHGRVSEGITAQQDHVV